MERPWPIQLSTDMLSWAPVLHSSTIAAQSDLVPLSPDASIYRLRIFTDAMPGGYMYQERRCGPAWAFCALAVTSLGISLILEPRFGLS